MKYKYGASYNSGINSDSGGLVIASPDCVSNNLNDIEKHIIAECEEGYGQKFYIDRDQLDNVIGVDTDQGGEVVSAVYYSENDDMIVVAVIFKEPFLPKAV